MDILSEFDLIARLTKNIAPRGDVVIGVGDDCAILHPHSDVLLLATCDSQVEGVHFTLQTSQPEQIGRKALAVNLSDIAAMGGEPRYALVSLILPSPPALDVVERIYDGLRQEAEQYTTAIVGGNIAGSAKQLIIDITLIGTVERGHALTRSGAHIGDTLFVTGTLGDSAAGLHTLLYPNLHYPQEACDHVRAAHCVPRARVAEGRVLSRLGTTVVTAMLDISDGLSGDLSHLCERSHVGARIILAQLPSSSSLHTIACCAACDPLHWVIHGGEDYQLLFTVSPGYERLVIETIQAEVGTTITAIGTICSAEDGLKLVCANGHEAALRIESWGHLRE